jgi:hypothetical protein
MKWILIIVTIATTYKAYYPGTDFPVITSASFETKEACVGAMKETRLMLMEAQKKASTQALTLDERVIMNCVPSK